VKDDTRAARAADQADPDRNHQFSRPWLTKAPAIQEKAVVTGPDEASASAHPLSWHPAPKAIRMKEAEQRMARASWWTR
jgi:hypothetical protein